MKWIKKGRIIFPQKNIPWMKSHAMLPTVVHLSDNLFRVYFSGRDIKNRSLIGYTNIKIIGDQIKLINYSEKPVLNLGERGCFDDNGVTPSCIIKNNDGWYMYYIGWNSGSTTTRMGLIAGLAIGKNNGEIFKRYSRAPILERTDREPFGIMTAPFVLFSNKKKLWEMWYVSCEGWRTKDLPTYNIKYASSKDGIDWTRNAKICIDFIDKNETALARPCVLFEDEIYKMWFSYKDPKIGYRIGYAESFDGVNWKRFKKHIGLDVGKRGDWDSEMIEYSYVFNHNGIKFMFYNGNGYGQNGAGYAVFK